MLQNRCLQGEVQHGPPVVNYAKIKLKNTALNDTLKWTTDLGDCNPVAVCRWTLFSTIGGLSGAGDDMKKASVNSASPSNSSCAKVPLHYYALRGRVDRSCPVSQSSASDLRSVYYPAAGLSAAESDPP